ncbi:MAG: TolC family protein [Ferruginibacter sp.]
MAVLLFSAVKAQEKWDLLKCVEYAMANNISIKQIDLQTRLADLQQQQSKLSRYPSLSFNGGPSFNSGRNQDPTSFSLITQNYISASMQLQSSAEIFNWFSKKNIIAANEWELEAAKANSDKLKNDISLAVANSYLQVLLAKSQEEIIKIQVEQSKVQLDKTRKMVDAGSLPELNATNLEAVLASDSSAYITARGNVTQAILSLKAYMNFDAAAPFEVATPPAEMIPLLNIADLQPDIVYASAIANQPQQKLNDFKLKAAQNNALAAKANMYPTISAYGSLGSGYNSRSEEIISSSQVVAPFANVTVNGTSYNVFPLQPFTSYTYGKTALFNQFNQNFRQSVGLNLSVPIFNGSSLRTNWERSKINVKNLELQKDLDNQTLKQNIYQAYNSAIVALEKFNASRKNVSSSELTYSFAQKRFDVGMLSNFDLVTTKNNVTSARLEFTLNQFDYIFKMKVLEFYKGQGLKL